jgi:hypothetical protein
MHVLGVLLTLLCYGVAVWLGMRERSWSYLLALIAGQLAALLDPLWQRLYGFAFDPGLGIARQILGGPLPTAVFWSSAWFYTLPALVVLYLYRHRWWFSSYTAALLTYGVFLLYHLLIQSLGRASGVWRFLRTDPLPFNIAPPLLSAILGALVSLMLLYMLLATHRYSLISLAAIVLPSALLCSLLVHGVLGAPLWVPVLLNAQRWALMLGTVGTLALVVWAVHIGASGITLADNRELPGYR